MVINNSDLLVTIVFLFLALKIMAGSGSIAKKKSETLMQMKSSKDTRTSRAACQ